MEESVFFDCDGIKLEGLFNKGENNKGVVVTHPHPLYGGNMHNNVVDSIARVYGAAGFSTLRFNFRGVGRSGGSHDNGDAEQDDLAAAMEFLLSNGLEIVDFAGYSFGTWVVAHYALDTSVQGDIVFVSPPAAFMDFSEIDSMPNLKFVVSGARDEFAPPTLIRELVPNWNANTKLEIIEDADHFFSTGLGQMEKLLTAHIMD